MKFPQPSPTFIQIFCFWFLKSVHFQMITQGWPGLSCTVYIIPNVTTYCGNSYQRSFYWTSLSIRTIFIFANITLNCNATQRMRTHTHILSNVLSLQIKVNLSLPAPPEVCAPSDVAGVRLRLLSSERGRFLRENACTCAVGVSINILHARRRSTTHTHTQAFFSSTIRNIGGADMRTSCVGNAIVVCQRNFHCAVA